MIMNPTYESQLISIRPKREVVYQVIYNFSITGFGGQNMFQQNLQHEFEIKETSAMNEIDGGYSKSIKNDLIGHYEWDCAYRYYVFDISHR